ncbi:MAG TPA: hypothetical protein VMA72_08420 [Streptosporangiaceae bacterium]|nr:hypothetical protein [Streptosporangiaceae bacterium]
MRTDECQPAEQGGQAGSLRDGWPGTGAGHGALSRAGAQAGALAGWPGTGRAMARYPAQARRLAR